jgi:HlyD family secretion protein
MEGIEVNLSSKVPGRIQSTCCSEGDTVQEGQIAVELNSDELRAAVAQATAGVERAKADIAFAESAVENAKALVQSADAAAASAKAEVEKARVQLAERKREMERSQELFQKAYISRESFDLAVTAHDTAAAALTAAQAQVNAAHAQRAAAAAQVNAANGQLSSSRARLKEAEAGLEVSQARLRDMVIISPVTGAVTFKALEKGEYAAAGVTIMTVVDPASLYVRIDLEETVVVGVPLHASARITAEGLTGKEFTGRVVEIGRYAEFATQRDVTRGRQDIRTFRVKVKPEDPNGLLKPGMTVFAEIRKKT